MIDIDLIRRDPDAVKAALASRGVEKHQIATITGYDRNRRAFLSDIQEAQAAKNAAVKKWRPGDAPLVHANTADLEAIVEHLDFKLRAAMLALPNIPAEDTPLGADATSNVQIARKEFETTALVGKQTKPHWELIDLGAETAVKMAGPRFTFLRGNVARLHRAIGQFALNRAVEAGYLECQPPVLLNRDAVTGTGQYPKFAADMFQTQDERYLAPTAEVGLTNSVRDMILPIAELPLRMTALTPCFRAEAGSAGRDTRGLIRQHQFDKVELVAVTTPDGVDLEFEKMRIFVADLLTALQLDYREVRLCVGDMGFSARRTHDFEVRMPGSTPNGWREVASLSDCGDFQARRMMARYKGDGTKGYVHTLNGTGCAVGRILAALVEQHQQNGGFWLPNRILEMLGL